MVQRSVYYSMIKKENNMNDDLKPGTMFGIMCYGLEQEQKAKENDNKCDECNEHSSVITYKEKNYCTWYCAKKG